MTSIGNLSNPLESITNFLEKLFKIDANLDTKTDLNLDEVILLNNIEYRNKKINDMWGLKRDLTYWTRYYKAKKISNNRGGRTEATNVLIAQQINQNQNKDTVDKLLGR